MRAMLPMASQACQVDTLDTEKLRIGYALPVSSRLDSERESACFVHAVPLRVPFQSSAHGSSGASFRLRRPLQCARLA